MWIYQPLAWFSALIALWGGPERLLSIPVPTLQIAGQILGRANTIDRLCSNLQVDISKAKNFLNWSPVISIDEGLRQCASLENS
jgi:hypothetical protein